MEAIQNAPGDEQELVTLYETGAEVEHTDDLVPLDPAHYGDEMYHPKADTVQAWDGQYLVCGDDVTLDRGYWDGASAHESDTVALLGDHYCLERDSYETTHGGDHFWGSDDDDLELVHAEDDDKWHPMGDCTSCIIGGYNQRSARWGYVYDNELVIYNNSDNQEYYQEALCDFDIGRNDDGDYYFSDDIHSNAGCNAEYHSLARRNYAGIARFTVGFEVEKEDSDAVSIDHGALYDETGWVKESDGSLDDDTGYELVTPAFDLFSDRLDTAIANNRDLQTLINGDYSDACGGHINFGHRGLTGDALFDAVTGWFPLIYAMFPSRADGYYARARNLKASKASREKFQAVAIHDDRIEFRVFGAVRNVKNLLWRRDLIRVMANSIKYAGDEVMPVTDPAAVLAWALDSDHPLYRHLRRVYTDERLLALVGRAVDFHLELEAEQLPVRLAIALKTPPAQLYLPHPYFAPVDIVTDLIEA